MRKIHCVEVLKEGFDDIPLNEVKEMVGWIEPSEKENGTWDVTMVDGSGFACKSQEIAQIMASTEEIKAMVLKNL